VERRFSKDTLLTNFPRGILRPPRAWAERVYDIRRWTVMKAGGHVATLAEPEALAEDVRAFFRGLRG
jgi:pimeloyl-ACP methyl ester carboxylesterase